MKLSVYIIPIIILALVVFARFRRVNVYNSFTEGIKGVYVGGKLVYDGKAFTGAAPGRMIRHNGCTQNL